MREAFCCICGKPGAWPVCKECRGETKEEEKPEKIKKLKEIQHHVEYFEAILQNRTTQRLSEEEIWDIIYEVQDTRNFNAWKKKEDIYFTSIKAARIVAKTLSKKFGLEILETRKHIGYDRVKSRKEFKWTICLKDKRH